MTKDDEIAALKAERDALIEELTAAYLLLSRMKNRLREVRQLRESVKAMAKKGATP
jgi:hypothetical protein